MVVTARFTANTLAAPTTVDLFFTRYPGATGPLAEQSIGEVPVTIRVDGREYHGADASRTLGPGGKITVPVSPHSVTTVELLYTVFEVRPHQSVDEDMVSSDDHEGDATFTRLVRVGYTDEVRSTPRSWALVLARSNFQADYGHEPSGTLTSTQEDGLRRLTGGH